VDVAGQTYTPVQGKLTLPGTDHCLLDEKREVFLDLELAPPEVRASAVVRQVLGDVASIAKIL
jgi:hypothetical protein